MLRRIDCRGCGCGAERPVRAIACNDIAHSKLRHGTKIVLISELRAIGDAVRKLRDRPLTLVSDSKLATRMVTRWMNGDDVLPPGYTTERANGKPAGLVTARHDPHGARPDHSCQATRRAAQRSAMPSHASRAATRWRPRLNAGRVPPPRRRPSGSVKQGIQTATGDRIVASSCLPVAVMDARLAPQSRVRPDDPVTTRNNS